jgi:hypothetical protein
VTLLSETSAAAWVEAALASPAWGTVASLVPPVFDAYARVLPPAFPDDGVVRYRWSQIAASRGIALSADTRFDDLVDGSDRWGRPSDGGLDIRETAALASVLAGVTDTPDEAYFCLWEGLGLPVTQALQNRPARVRTPHRAYHLLTGPVTAASLLAQSGKWTCVSLWWPADRAWLVATDIDLVSTYVGGSAGCIAELLTAPDLETAPAEPKQRVTWDADQINPPPPDAPD